MLKADRVEAIVTACLFSQEETHKEANGAVVPNAGLPVTRVEGIMVDYGFNTDRLNQYKPEIVSWLAELPDTFMAGKGEGDSFLLLCWDKDHRQWTSMHRTMEAFCCLCIGVGVAKWRLPRPYWGGMPGGLPLIVFDPSGVKTGGSVEDELTELAQIADKALDFHRAARFRDMSREGKNMH